MKFIVLNLAVIIKLKKSFSILLFFCLSIKIAYSQDPTFSQTYNNPLYYNPGFTGLYEGLNIYTNIRNQWPKIPSQKISSAFSTKTISADINSHCIRSGFGLLLLDDNEGEGRLRTLSLSGSYAFKIVDDKKITIQAGFQGSFVQKKIDWERLEFSDQINKYNIDVIPASNPSPVDERIYYPDFNFGVVGAFESFHKKRKHRNKKYWVIGAAVSHLTQPNQAFFNTASQLPLKYCFQISLFHSLSQIKSVADKNFFIPMFQWEKQDEFRNAEFGFFAKSPWIGGGIGFRDQRWFLLEEHYDAIVFDLDINVDRPKDSYGYKFGLSFDKTISKLSGSTWGTIELTLKMSFPDIDVICGEQSSKGNKHMKCPNY